MKREIVVSRIHIMRTILAVSQVVFYLIGVILTLKELTIESFIDMIVIVLGLLLWGFPCFILSLTVFNEKKFCKREYFALAIGLEIGLSLIYNLTEAIATPRFQLLSLAKGQPRCLLIGYYLTLGICLVGVCFGKIVGVKMTSLITVMANGFVFVWFYVDHGMPPFDIFTVCYSMEMMHCLVALSTYQINKKDGPDYLLWEDSIND